MKSIEAAASDDVVDGRLCAVKVAGRSILLSRVHGKVCAFSAKCPHIGLSLARGSVIDGVIRCPWHGSRFDMTTGANIDWTNAFAGVAMPKWTHGLLTMGKKPAPLETFAASERDGAVYVAIEDTSKS